MTYIPQEIRRAHESAVQEILRAKEFRKLQWEAALLREKMKHERPTDVSDVNSDTFDPIAVMKGEKGNNADRRRVEKEIA